MAKRFWALTVLTVFLLAAGTARAQSVDDKIKSLEQELSRRPRRRPRRCHRSSTGLATG